jgi:ABC-type transport system involved in cytochrome bd biosynthesis fused ATPase/permease subunit
MRGRTTFIIAHRLTTLKNCDVRLEMSEGRLTRMDSSGPGGLEAAQTMEELVAESSRSDR